MTERQQLDAELTAILPYLPGWKLDPTYANHTWCAVLIDGTGRGIHVSITQAKGRFYISGMWPSDSDHQQCRPDKCQHITIARNRQPEKVAAEITAALSAVVHGCLCRAKRAHHVAQCRPQPPARSDRRTSRLVRAKGRARGAKQSEPDLRAGTGRGSTRGRNLCQHRNAIQEPQGRQGRAAGRGESGRT